MTSTGGMDSSSQFRVESGATIWPGRFLDNGQVPIHSNRVLEQAVAAVGVLALGVRIPLVQGITPGYFIAIALLPVWYRSLRHYKGARWVFWLALACVPFALILVDVNALDHGFSGKVFLGTFVLVLGLVCGLGFLLWAQEVIPRGLVGALFGTGMLVGGLADPGALTAGNPLKFAVALPAAIIVLSLVDRPDRMGRQLLAALALGLFGAAIDARSFFAICLLTAALVGWQLRPRITSRRRSWAWTALLIAAIGAIAYYAGTTLLVDGYLGAETQQRTIAQIETSGSLLLGGRPELGATAALMEFKPWGYGAGTVPNLIDVNTAKTGMAALGYDPNNGYVEGYMFGASFNLHSLIGDTWASFGFAGVLLAFSSLYLIVRGAASRIAERRGTALIIFLTSGALWNTFFSPFYAAIPLLTLSLAFLLLPANDATEEMTDSRTLRSGPTTTRAT